MYRYDMCKFEMKISMCGLCIYWESNVWPWHCYMAYGIVPYTILFELYGILNVLFFLSIYYYVVHLESVCLLNTQSSWYEFVFGQTGVMTLLIKDLICPLSSSACTHTHIPLLLWGSEPTRSQIKATSQLPHQHYLQWFYTRGWSSRATLLQSLAPTLKNPGEKIPDRILKTLISYFRCVWLGLELNSAGHRPSRINVPHPFYTLCRL